VQGIDNAEIIETVHARRVPMVPVRATLERRRRAAHRALRQRRCSRFFPVEDFTPAYLVPMHRVDSVERLDVSAVRGMKIILGRAAVRP
jgi:hypothetical protein